MFDVGSGDMALEESAGASVAQADWLTVTDAERGQHQGQHGDDLGVHGVGGRARRRLQSWAARGHRGGPRVKVRQRVARAGRFRAENQAGRGSSRGVSEVWLGSLTRIPCGAAALPVPYLPTPFLAPSVSPAPLGAETFDLPSPQLGRAPWTTNAPILQIEKLRGCRNRKLSSKDQRRNSVFQARGSVAPHPKSCQRTLSLVPGPQADPPHSQGVCAAGDS